MMDEDNLTDLRQLLASQLARHSEIHFAVLYGSAAEGGPFRDLDVGLFVDRSAVPASRDWDFAFELAVELEAAISYPVDVRVINDASLPFRFSVSRGIPLLVNDEETWVNFLEWTWIMYFDFQPVAMQYLKEMK
ncbi:MAG TPA: nucleotidyltransferase domain-containing protein [Chloroflexi bacterium]|jgi:predicted nucleotidyltransferase|nr:nucleotidyltransferase domain-containing protein [Chloroflexota bacterium]